MTAVIACHDVAGKPVQCHQSGGNIENIITFEAGFFYTRMHRLG
jgi:hypothetical protein